MAREDIAEEAEEDGGDPWREESVQPIVGPPTTSTPGLTDQQIDDLYLKGETRIVTQGNDFLIPNLLQSLADKQFLDLSPPYQRRLRWSRDKQSRLIESLLMNVPIPPVFLFERDLGEYEVMDGQQRLSTIQAFFNNEFKLTGLETWASLNGKSYHTLPPAIQRGLQRRSISAVILLVESGKTAAEGLELRRAVFERLNTGGERLNPQEVRNAIYAGPLNDMIAELSREELFTRVWGIPPKEKGEPLRVSARLAKNALYRKMIDRELVLRVVALTNSPADEVRGGMHRTLDDFMNRHRDADPQTLAVWAREFRDALSVAFDIYGPNTFRLSAANKRGPVSRSLYDATMAALIDLARDSNDANAVYDALRADSESIVERTRGAMAKEDDYRLLRGTSSTKQQTLDRIALVKKILQAD